MFDRRYTTMAWDQVATQLPFLSGKNGSGHSCQGYHTRITQLAQTREKLVFTHGGRLDLETEKLVHGPKLERATQRFSYALQAKAIGAFRPNRDELMYAIGTTEHSGRTRGLGRNISWEHGFPNDRDTYRSRQRRKDEEAAWISRLEEYVRESREALLQAQERKKHAS